MSGKINFDTLMNTRSDIGSLKEKMKGMTENKGEKTYEPYPDESFFSYTRDKAGNAFCIIRFLPCVYEDQKSPIVERFRHFFNVDGRWLVEHCPSSPTSPYKEKCPICSDNNRWWDEKSVEYRKYGKAECEKIGRERKRNMDIYTNIYVVKNTQDPDTEGKVFIWKINSTIKKMIDRALSPTESDVLAGKKAIDVFSLTEGANFELNLYTESDGDKKYVKYDNCKFHQPSPLFPLENKEHYETVYNNIFDLYPFVDKKLFKSIDKLEIRLAEVLGDKPIDVVPSEQSTPSPKIDTHVPAESPKNESKIEDPIEDTSDEELDDLFDDLN